MIFRIVSVVLLLVSVCVLPFYITILLGLLFVVLFKNCYEIILVFFVNDALYATDHTSLWGFHFWMTSIAILLYIGSRFFQKHIFEGSFLRK